MSVAETAIRPNVTDGADVHRLLSTVGTTELTAEHAAFWELMVKEVNRLARMRGWPPEELQSHVYVWAVSHADYVATDWNRGMGRAAPGYARPTEIRVMRNIVRAGAKLFKDYQHRDKECSLDELVGRNVSPV